MEGTKLKNAIAGKGLTQEEAANKLGIARQTLTNWMNRGLLDDDVKHKVSRALEIDLLEDIPAFPSESLYLQIIAEKDRVIKMLEDKIKDLEARFYG